MSVVDTNINDQAIVNKFIRKLKSEKSNELSKPEIYRAMYYTLCFSDAAFANLKMPHQKEDLLYS